MKINLHIIFDSISETLIDTNITSEIDLKISNIRIFSPYVTSLVDDYLYIVENQDIELFLQHQSSAPFAVVHSQDYYMFPEDREWIIFNPIFSLSQASNTLSEVFDYYNSWEKKIYSHIFQNSTLNEIFEICCEPIVNPCALFDSSLFLIASAGELPENPDYAWKILNKYGYFPLELANPEQLNCTGAHKHPALYHFPGYISMWSGLYSQDKLIGYIGSTNIHKNHSYGQMSIFYGIQLILQNCPNVIKSIYQTKQQNGFILKELLLEKPVDESILEHYVTEMKWTSSDTHQLVYLFSDDTNEIKIKSSLFQQIMLELVSVIINDFVTPFENGILILLNQSIATNTQNKLKISCIEKILHKYNLTGTASYPFSSIKNISNAYKQCLLTQAVQTETNKLHYFTDYYQKCILRELASKNPLECFIHPGIKKISLKKQGCQLIHTFKIFLANGRNIALTAEQLFVHRNTLTYRIHLIESILDVDLHSISESTLFELYFSCLIIENTF